MLLAIAAGGVALVAVVAEVLAPRVARRRRPRVQPPPVIHDPGRELRAEQRARALLRSCVNEQEWEMYRDLGFLRVWARTPAKSSHTERCAYLLYPHKPIVACLPETRRLVGEYCVTFDDESRPYGSAQLPASDDVLAKWMALKGDEEALISVANMHLPGRQIDPEQVERDLQRLERWERARPTASRSGRAPHAGQQPTPPSVPTPQHTPTPAS